MKFLSSDQPHHNTKHGHARRGKVSPTFKSWVKMHERCKDPKAVNYQRYGAKGIEVCRAWESFETFLADMGEKPSGMTLDRIDSTKSYSKENCRWATIVQQARNKSNNVIFELDGKSQCLAAWAEHYGIDYFLASYRLRHGWTILEALTTPRLKGPNKGK